MDLGNAWSELKTDSTKISYRGEPLAAQIVSDNLSNSNFDAKIIANQLTKITGFYAVIARSNDTTVAAVDHIRSIPLFYYKNSENSSVVRVGPTPYHLLNSCDVTPFDPVALRDFAMTGVVTGPDTLVSGLFQLQAGEVRVWNFKSKKTDCALSYRHWPRTGVVQSHDQSRRNLASIVDNIFARTITAANGRPILVPLSGGLDSRLILAKLVEHGYHDLRAFSYGPRGNADAVIAKSVAAKLGVRWEFIPTNTPAARALINTEMLDLYWKFSDGLCAVPNHQDLSALSVLSAKGNLPADSVIVNGQSGDFITGGHIPPSLCCDGSISVAAIINAIRDKHYGLWKNLLTPENILHVEARIRSRLDIDQATKLITKREAVAYFELWEYKERQAKYVVNGQRIYDFLNIGWTLPLWDREYVAFWRDAPLQEKYRQALYRDWLQSWDYEGVFSTISNRVTAWPQTISALIAPIAIVSRLLIGRARRDRIFRYLNYFDRFGDQYKLFGLYTFVRHAQNMRNPTSLFARTWLERHGVQLESLKGD